VNKLFTRLVPLVEQELLTLMKPLGLPRFLWGSYACCSIFSVLCSVL